jgi:preprotein translocase subunit SecA
MAQTLKQGIPLIEPILNWIIGSRNERFVKKYLMRVAAINALEPAMRKLTDAQLRGKIDEFRARIDKGENGGDLLIDAFAAAREAMDRAVGIRNIFNPKFAELFEASKLSPQARELYEQTKAQIAATPPLLPSTLDPNKQAQLPPNAVRDEKHEFRGAPEIIEGWQQVDIPVELYEAVREVYTQSKPPFRARPFDVQLIGGMVLYQGKISEMKTGEGKTIVGPLACYLAAIEGLKVHVVTVNDYLVQRDRDWTYPYFRALGLTVGAIHPMHMQPEYLKREMYKCDVVYGTTSEFGFDYLRDNMKRSEDQQVQKARSFAIVDEVDSILIDEARTPLIISGAAHDDSPRYEMANRLALHLVEKQKPWQAADDRVQHCQRMIKGLEGDIRNARDKDKIPQLQDQLRQAKADLPEAERERKKHIQYYEIQMDRKQAHLTHDGIAEAQRSAGVGSFYVGENMDVPHLLEQSVRAHVVYQRDRDYIVAPSENPQTGRTEPSIVIVDVNTGRPMVGRQWSDGLHQACETKEGVPIRQETQTVATITIQNFFKMYKRLAGMTGTADTEAQEFHDIYKLDVVSIPTNLAVIRRDFDDLMFLVGKDKWDFIVDEIKHFHDAGRPVLVGTTSVEKSETLSKMLSQKYGVKHEVLNAKQHERESLMIESAGQLGAVMIATNMAGRGTDIKLGKCTRQQLLDHWLRRGICSRELTIEASTEQLRENVYRKIGASELELPKREVEQMAFADLELKLLRHWAMRHTMESPKRIEGMAAPELREILDKSGRFLLHRIDWFESIEALGGLHVIGTERHESRRIDNQLRGRAGRQGDQGSSRFFVSLDDELMKLFAGERTMKILSTLGMKEGDCIEHSMLSKSVERAQRKVEERNFQIRKNILEYDEVMEHQRQAFYGLRQRVIEGRNVRGLIFDYITDAISDAVSTYLDRDYAAECASEYVKQTMEVSIFPDRLRGLDVNEMDRRIRLDARDEIRQTISVTLGEYMPAEGSEVEVDFDTEGLARWAKSHFNLEMNPEEIRAKGLSGRKAVQDMLLDAAFKHIQSAPLDGLAKFAEKSYGAQELVKWADQKFGIKITLEAVQSAAQQSHEAVEALVVKQAEELYRKKEREWPAEFAMATSMSLARQNPIGAFEQLCAWANERYGLGWTVDSLRQMGPQVAREQLKIASEKFVDSGVLEQRINEALAISDPEALAKWFRETLKSEPPENLKRLVGNEREDKIRARIESVLRAELLYFERTILLETLDDLWKTHLYSMDQLRDSIHYRAFSQQDPRIEYKREGSKQFTAMLEQVRERVTDYIFKVQVPAPQFAPQQRPAPAPQAPRPAAPPSASPYYTPPSGNGSGAGAGVVAGVIAGPGIDASPARVGTAATPMSERSQRDLEAAQRAGTGTAGAESKAAPVVKSEKRYGRNDPCPMGCGRKYKKCCNKPDGTCDGSGMNAPHTPDGDDN